MVYLEKTLTLLMIQYACVLWEWGARACSEGGAGRAVVVNGVERRLRLRNSLVVVVVYMRQTRDKQPQRGEVHHMAQSNNGDNGDLQLRRVVRDKLSTRRGEAVLRSAGGVSVLVPVATEREVEDDLHVAEVRARALVPQAEVRIRSAPRGRVGVAAVHVVRLRTRLPEPNANVAALRVKLGRVHPPVAIWWVQSVAGRWLGGDYLHLYGGLAPLCRRRSVAPNLHSPQAI